jgi:hypothetical protein
MQARRRRTSCRAAGSGADNRVVLRDWLGLGDAEIDDLVEAAVI